MTSTVGASSDVNNDYALVHKPNACRYFQFTDLGNAQTMVERFGNNFLYCTTSKKWYFWNGKIWEKDTIQEIRRCAIRTVHYISSMAQEINDDELSEKLRKWARTSENFQRQANMIKSAEPYLSVRNDEWDADDNLFNTLTGTIELDTCTFREHRKEDRLTKMSGVAYNPEMKCPLWEEHLSTVFDNDQELIDAFQVMSGYTLLPVNPEQVFNILFGTGRNGKSVTMNVLSNIMGDYSVTVAPQTLMVQRSSSGGPRSDVVRLEGARLITASEGDAGDVLSEELIKRITGGDIITARPLYQNEREFVAGGKVWFSTNHKPSITSSGISIWRRVRLWPFDVAIPTEIVDPDMENHLLAEKSGIFNWMLAGLQIYLTKGLLNSSKVLTATKQYKEESDQIGRFIKDCCIQDSSTTTCKIARPDLREAYQVWCQETDEVQLTHKDFAKRLQEHGITKPDGGNRYWGNIRLKI